MNPKRFARGSAESSARGTRGAPHKVRIIGGRWKRTPLPVPELPGLRPTPDRVRETVFNWLAVLRPDLASLRVLDMFAGTGALGFEAASRGAQRVTLVEQAPSLLAQLRVLRDKLGANQIEIVAGDALAAAARWPAGSFDLVFIDPPYDAGLQAAALAAACRLLAGDGLAYVESDADQDLAITGFAPLREARAGRVAYRLLQRVGAPAGAFD